MKTLQAFQSPTVDLVSAQPVSLSGAKTSACSSCFTVAYQLPKPDGRDVQWRSGAYVFKLRCDSVEVYLPGVGENVSGMLVQEEKLIENEPARFYHCGDLYIVRYPTVTRLLRIWAADAEQAGAVARQALSLLPDANLRVVRSELDLLPH